MKGSERLRVAAGILSLLAGIGMSLDGLAVGGNPWLIACGLIVQAAAFGVLALGSADGGVPSGRHPENPKKFTFQGRDE